MATTTTNFGWDIPQSTDLVKDGATAIAALGQDIDTALVDLKGGTTGQVLAKASNTDLDYSWVAQDDSNAIQNTIVDAKGDLISATGSDVPARLAVGANGTSLVADSSQTTGLGWTATPNASNVLLNSGFQIWQRGTSFAIPANTSTYSADRWTSYRTATGSTVSRQVTNDTTNLAGVQYCARVQRDSGNTSTAIMYFTQAVESVNTIPLANQRITYSFWARAGANYSATSSVLSSTMTSGTGTDQAPYAGYTGATNFATGSHTLTTTWTRFTVTGDVPNNASEMLIQFSNTPVGTAGVNDYYEVTGVMINIGSTALPFRTYSQTIAGELAACQRYYFRATASNNYTTFGVGANYSTTATQIHVNHPVQMRIGPASVDYSTLGLVNSIGGIVTFTTLTLSFTGPLTSMLGVTGASGLVAGYANLLLANNSTSGYLAFSAEL
jgi:hypothetical protein